MSRDKQIKEMVKHCHFYEDGDCILCEVSWVECDAKCDMCEFAKQLYNAGYRKDSDVAREIFEEIEIMHCSDGYHYFISKFRYDELKKKYLGKDINVSTKESEDKDEHT